MERLVSFKDSACQSPRIRFCYWQLRSSAAAARSALARGSQCCGSLPASLPPSSHGTLCMDRSHKLWGSQGQSRLAPTREDTLCLVAQGLLGISEAQRPPSSLLAPTSTVCASSPKAFSLALSSLPTDPCLSQVHSSSCKVSHPVQCLELCPFLTVVQGLRPGCFGGGRPSARMSRSICEMVLGFSPPLAVNSHGTIHTSRL